MEWIFSFELSSALSFLGGLPHAGTNMLSFMERMRRKYGRIFSFNMGTKPIIVLADFELYSEIAGRDEFQVLKNSCKLSSLIL